MSGSNKYQRDKRNDNILLLDINLSPKVGRGGMGVRSVLQALQKNEGGPDRDGHPGGNIAALSPGSARNV